jgi:hypothetical protein
VRADAAAVFAAALDFGFLSVLDAAVAALALVTSEFFLATFNHLLPRLSTYSHSDE